MGLKEQVKQGKIKPKTAIARLIDSAASEFDVKNIPNTRTFRWLTRRLGK